MEFDKQVPDVLQIGGQSKDKSEKITKPIT